MLWAGRSHRGRSRTRNEDSWGLRPKVGVAAVADGVGGSPGGDRAALLAIDWTLATLPDPTWPDRDGTGRRQVVQNAHRAILDAGDRDPMLTGMATTLTAIRWANRRVEGLHVGDSRAYRLDDDGLTALTHDHTPAGEALRRGAIERPELRRHPRGHLLLRALGGDHEAPEPELFEMDPFPPGSALFLCTDGIEAALAEPDVADLLGPVLEDRDPEGALDRLFEAALAAGAPDNLAAILLFPS